VYEYRLRLGAPTEHGARLDAVVSGPAPPPRSGLRVDLPLEGEATGRLAGTVKGVDYLFVRADGRMQNPLQIWAVGEADMAKGVVKVRGYRP
jgi:hypothetical protein